jgi:hypothetical protein
VLGALQIVSTVVATALLIFWNPAIYALGAAFVWMTIFALFVVRERELKTTLYQNKIRYPSESVEPIYAVISSLILAGLWPGLPIIVWYDFGTVATQNRSRGSERL